MLGRLEKGFDVTFQASPLQCALSPQVYITFHDLLSAIGLTHCSGW